MLVYIVIGFVAIVGIYTAYLQIRTRKSGIETEATVVDVREKWVREGDGDSLEYTYVVSYKNREGEKVEAALATVSNGKKNLEIGDRITVRYLPERQDYPVMTGRL